MLYRCCRERKSYSGSPALKAEDFLGTAIVLDVGIGCWYLDRPIALVPRLHKHTEPDTVNES